MLQLDCYTWQHNVFDSSFIIELGPAVFACNTRITTSNQDEITSVGFFPMKKIGNT